MPCLLARLPVAIEFHSIGERMGRKVARFPITPWLMKSSSVGIKPWSSRGLITFQSAASQPIRRPFLASGSGITAHAGGEQPLGTKVYHVFEWEVSEFRIRLARGVYLRFRFEGRCGFSSNTAN